MPAAKASKKQTYVLVGPSSGLTKEQVSKLKKRFKNELISTLGGPNAVSRGEIVLRIVYQTPD